MDNDKEVEDDREEEKGKGEMVDMLYKYMKKKVCGDGYLMLEILVSGGGYIKERMKDGCGMSKILLVEFFDMGRSKCWVRYMWEVKEDIRYWEEKGKEELD